jgi:GxxExxY protein
MGTRDNDELTERIIGFAIEVHRSLGPGLLESVYEECLCLELNHAKLCFRRQVALPVSYKGFGFVAVTAWTSLSPTG